MDELAAARAFQLKLANHIYLCYEILAHKAEKRPMKTTIAHGPEVTRFDSFEDWQNTWHDVYQMNRGGPSYVVHIDARGRICTRSSHYLRARDEEAFPIVVYAIDGEQ